MIKNKNELNSQEAIIVTAAVVIVFGLVTGIALYWQRLIDLSTNHPMIFILVCLGIAITMVGSDFRIFQAIHRKRTG